MIKEQNEKKIATLLAGTGIIPISEGCLEDILVNEHFMITEESEDGESEENFMRRIFSKALRNKAIVESTKQCMVINVPVGHGKMSLDEIEQLSSYIARWSIGDIPYTMNWGLYEIHNSTKMRITIVANSLTLPLKDKDETSSYSVPDKLTRRVIVMCFAAIVGIVSVALSLHYMELGMIKHPIGTGSIEYLKYILQQSCNRYEVYSMLCWAIGVCALLYVILSINVKPRIKNRIK